MKPSVHYRQHHDVEPPIVDLRAFRQGWRVRSHLDRLLVDGAITRAEWQAGDDFRATWSSALPSRASTLLGMRVRGHDPDAGMLARLAALTRLRRLGNAMGPGPIAVLVACIVDDLSWRELGRRLGVDHKTARAVTVRALWALADYARGGPARAAGAGP